MDEGLIRPLDDLVAQYGQSLLPNQLIFHRWSGDGGGLHGNGQHFSSARTSSTRSGSPSPPPMPKCWPPPRRSAPRASWKTAGRRRQTRLDLAAEFVNLYLGTGADFFEPGTANLAIDNADGREVLETMRAMIATWSRLPDL